MAEAEELRSLLEQVLDGATGDAHLGNNKRVWPIKSALYREIARVIGYEYDQKRAMKNQELGYYSYENSRKEYINATGKPEIPKDDAQP